MFLLFCLQINFQTHGAVVGAKGIFINGGGGNFIRDPVGNDKIVNTPACVLFSGFEHIAPPSIAIRCVGVQMAEGVGKTCLQCLGEACPLFIGETGIAPIGFGILQVDFIVGHIQIAAGDDGLGFIQFGQIGAEGFVPF